MASLDEDNVMEVGNGRELAIAISSNPVVDTALLTSDVWMRDADWDGLLITSPNGTEPILLSRNFTILGSPLLPSWPLLNLGYVQDKIRIGNGVTLMARHVVVGDFRSGLTTQAPGFDLAAPTLMPTTADKKPALLLHNETAVLYSVCFPKAIWVQSITTAVRPSALPGTQQAHLGVSQQGCSQPIEGDAASFPGAGSGDPGAVGHWLLASCWPDRGLFDDLAFVGADIDEFDKLSPNNYNVWLQNVTYLCAHVMELDCIQRLTPLGCALSVIRNFSVNGVMPWQLRPVPMPPPEPMQQQQAQPQASPLPSLVPGAAQPPVEDGGSGTGRKVVLGAALGGGLGGALLLGLALAALFVWARNVHRSRSRTAERPSVPEKGLAELRVELTRSGCEQAADGMAAAAPQHAPSAPPKALLCSRTQHDALSTKPEAVVARPESGSGFRAKFAPEGLGADAGASDSGGNPQDGRAACSIRAAGCVDPGGTATPPIAAASNEAFSPADASANTERWTTPQDTWCGSQLPSQPHVGSPSRPPHPSHPPDPSSHRHSPPSRGSLASAPPSQRPSQQPQPSQRLQPPQSPPRLPYHEDEHAVITAHTPPRAELALGLTAAADVTLLPVVRGRGTYGRVYEGMYRGQRVAVKVVREVACNHANTGGNADGDPAAGSSWPRQARETFAQEVEVLGRCDHPHVVRLLAACLQPPRILLVMELMETSLERMVYTRRPGDLLPLRTVLHIAIGVARGLEYLHPTILHRDLKPANILINDPTGECPVAKITDFGVSRLRSTMLITQNPEAGTPAYMAPETFDVNNYQFSHHVDIFSFGVCVWAMLTGKRPWGGFNIVDVAYRVAINQERLPLGDLPPERCPPRLAALLAQCWEHEPRRRPAAAELVKELRMLLEGLP